MPKELPPETVRRPADVQTRSATGDPFGAADTLAGESDHPSPAASHAELDERYSDCGRLGRGGMGEVRLCHDARIGREVALKVIRSERASHDKARTRFFKEAKVQGQLEHPAVVPVYDLDTTEDGRPFFTMRRVAGQTLADIIRMRDDEQYSRRRLLSAFSQVCLAVDYAHERGVVHRDLKPSNIMLGDFGEVYVLDWGLAKTVSDEDHGEGGDPISFDDLGPASETIEGEVLGTPGYMAPEQLDGVHGNVGPHADIYALGAILFELLTFEPLHQRKSPQQAIGSTIDGADARAHARYPDRQVPPELEAICVRATQDDREDRFGSVREMQQAVERYLDGDRDAQLRRELAQSYLDQAMDGFRSLAQHDAEAQRTVMNMISRALAFDPENVEARAALMHLLTRPPASVPDEVREQLEVGRRASERKAARGGMAAYVAWLPFAGITLLMGVRSWGVLAAILGLIALGIVVSYLGSRAKNTSRYATGSLVISTVTLVLLSRLLGPLVLIPGLAGANALSFTQHATGGRRMAYVAISAMAVVVPSLFELAGVWPPSYRFIESGMLIVPHLASLPMVSTVLLLLLASITTIVLPALLMREARDSVEESREQLAVQAWQLRQLVPERASRINRIIEAPKAA
ncbi:MAG: protein kinase domain-containing protein [Nannocystaceae bacterium]|nr:protein kinase [bacterium]